MRAGGEGAGGRGARWREAGSEPVARARLGAPHPAHRLPSLPSARQRLQTRADLPLIGRPGLLTPSSVSQSPCTHVREREAAMEGDGKEGGRRRADGPGPERPLDLVLGEHDDVGLGLVLVVRLPAEARGFGQAEACGGRRGSAREGEGRAAAARRAGTDGPRAGCWRGRLTDWEDDVSRGVCGGGRAERTHCCRTGSSCLREEAREGEGVEVRERDGRSTRRASGTVIGADVTPVWVIRGFRRVSLSSARVFSCQSTSRSLSLSPHPLPSPPPMSAPARRPRPPSSAVLRPSSAQPSSSSAASSSSLTAGQPKLARAPSSANLASSNARRTTAAATASATADDENGPPARSGTRTVSGKAAPAGAAAAGRRERVPTSSSSSTTAPSTTPAAAAAADVNAPSAVDERKPAPAQEGTNIEVVVRCRYVPSFFPSVPCARSRLCSPRPVAHPALGPQGSSSPDERCRAGARLASFLAIRGYGLACGRPLGGWMGCVL